MSMPPPATPPSTWPPPGVPPRVPPPDDPLISTSIEAWFGRSYAATRRSVARVAQVWLLALLPMSPVIGLALAASFAAEPAGYVPGAPTIALFVVAFAVAVFVGYGALAASVFVVITDAAGQRVPMREVLRYAAARALPLLGWTLLGGLAVLVGLVLLIVPGVYLIPVVGTLMCVVCVERTGLRRCLELVRGRWWPTAGRVLLNSAVVNCLQIPMQLVVMVIGVLVIQLLQAGGGPMIPGVIVLGTVGLTVVVVGVVLAAVASTAMYVVTYAELRWRENPEVTTTTLAAELTRSSPHAHSTV